MERIEGCAQGHMSHGAVDFFVVAVRVGKMGNIPSVPVFVAGSPRWLRNSFAEESENDKQGGEWNGDVPLLNSSNHD